MKNLFKGFLVLALIALFSFTSNATTPEDSLVKQELVVDSELSDGSTEVYTAVVPVVDTIESISEIVEQGTYYVKNTPGKDGSVLEWAGWVIGLLGLLFGAIMYFVRPSSPESRED